MKAFTLYDFVRESNRIEGISRTNGRELVAHEELLAKPRLMVVDIELFVSVVAPGKPLRSQPTMNVRVGSHIAPPGGPGIVAQLADILSGARRGDEAEAFATHRRYETLHPFMDGNGRSGRALWLWMMGGINCAPLGFLHHWYYQSLAIIRPTPDGGEK